MTAKKRLGEMLIEAGVIDEIQLKAALGHQRQWGMRLGQALVEMKLTTEAQVVRALSAKFGYEIAQIDAAAGYPLEQALKLVPREFAVKNNVLPLAADTGTITVAMSDPANVALVDELRFRTGRKVKICMGGDQEIAEGVRRFYPGEVVEPIALDLDGDESGEPVLDPFGGGSKAALEAFFGRGVEGAPEADGPAPEPAPPAARPAPAARPPPAPARSAAPPSPQNAPPRSAPAAAPRPAPAAGAPPPAAPPAGAPARPATAPRAPPAPGPAAEPARGREPQPLRPAAPARPSPPLAAPPGQGQAAPAPQAAPSAPRDAREAALLAAIARMAAGGPVDAEVLKPVQALAAVLRLLLRRGVITERELVDELMRR